MTHVVHRLSHRLVFAGLLATIAATTPALAQQVKGSKGSIMSIEELRACMVSKEASDKARADVQARNDALVVERDAVKQSSAALKTEGEEIAQRNAQVRSINERARAMDEKVKSWNARAAAVKDAPRGEQDKLMSGLEAEKIELQKISDALAADRAQLPPGFNDRVTAYNARVQEYQKSVQALNDKIAQVEEANKAATAQRDAWNDSCADRRYREDDEIAIKRGK